MFGGHVPGEVGERPIATRADASVHAPKLPVKPITLDSLSVLESPLIEHLAFRRAQLPLLRFEFLSEAGVLRISEALAVSGWTEERLSIMAPPGHCGLGKRELNAALVAVDGLQRCVEVDGAHNPLTFRYASSEVFVHA